MPAHIPHFVIIGGGITGLAAALQLETRAKGLGSTCKITLLEASPRIGGKLLSERVGDFIVDAGPDVFMAKKPYGIELCHTLGLKDQLQETDPSTRITYIREGDALTPVSMYEDEPLATLRNGIQSLADAAESALRITKIVRDTRANSIEVSNDRFLIRTQNENKVLADAVIIAISASATAEILSELIPTSSDLFSAVSYTRTTTVSVGYHKNDVPNPLNGYGYIVRNPTMGNVSACTWSSSKIRGRAPENHVLIRAFVRGTDLASEDLQSTVLREFRDTLGITAAPIFIRSYEWPEAIPMYAEHHAKQIEILDEKLRAYPGLVIAGSAIQATGIPDSIRSGTEAANVVWGQVVDGVAAESPIHRTSVDATSARSFFAR